MYTTETSKISVPCQVLPPSQALRVVLLVLVFNWAPLAPIGSLGSYL